ncbi:MAG: cytochrome c maturation protein CcmE [Bacteroidota bacterium]
MKKTYIVGLVMIIAAISLFTLAGKDMSSYSTFADARESGQKVTVAATLSKDKEMTYDPTVDANFFSLYVKDGEGEERKVILYAAKPQDFERSEQIVLTGTMEGDTFMASDMLMKCPSKYKDEEIYIQGEQNS